MGRIRNRPWGTGISARRLDQPFQAAGALLDFGQVERIQAYATAAGLELVEIVRGGGRQRGPAVGAPPRWPAGDPAGGREKTGSSARGRLEAGPALPRCGGRAKPDAQVGRRQGRAVDHIGGSGVSRQLIAFRLRL